MTARRRSSAAACSLAAAVTHSRAVAAADAAPLDQPRHHGRGAVDAPGLAPVELDDGRQQLALVGRDRPVVLGHAGHQCFGPPGDRVGPWARLGVVEGVMSGENGRVPERGATSTSRRSAVAVGGHPFPVAAEAAGGLGQVDDRLGAAGAPSWRRRARRGRWRRGWRRRPRVRSQPSSSARPSAARTKSGSLGARHGAGTPRRDLVAGQVEAQQAERHAAALEHGVAPMPGPRQASAGALTSAHSVSTQ